MPSFSHGAGPTQWLPLMPRKHFVEAVVLKPILYVISGVTRDANGVALGNCDVMAYETTDGIEPHNRPVSGTKSLADGTYSISVHATPGATFQVDAYKTGATPLAGTTVDTLTAAVG